MAAVVLLVGQTLLNNADLLIAKAVFDPKTAGVYAAAVLGRSVFFVSWSVVHAVFPVMASASSSPAQRRRAAATAVVIIALVGLAGIGVSLVAGEQAVTLLFGDEYLAAGALLVPYLAATSLFALANLIAAVDLARGRQLAPAILAAGALLQTVALALWARTTDELVQGQVIGTAIIVTALVMLVFVRGVRARHEKASSEHGNSRASVRSEERRTQ